MKTMIPFWRLKRRLFPAPTSYAFLRSIFLPALTCLVLTSIITAADLDPKLVGTWPPLGGEDTTKGARAIALLGTHAIVAEAAGGIRVFEMSNPAFPRQVGACATTGRVEAVTVSGNYAYLASGSAGLEVIDLSSPTNPRRVGGETFVSGSAKAVAVSLSFAYVAVGEAGLGIMDVSDPSSPFWVGNFDTSGSAWGVAVSGDYVYVADGLAGLQVLDITTPDFPVPVGACTTLDGARAVTISGRHAYVASGLPGEVINAGLDVIDISIPASPTWVGGYRTTHNAARIAVSGTYAAVVLKEFCGDSGCYGGGLQFFDISDPTRPRPVGKWSESSPEGGYPRFPADVAVAGPFAYVATVPNCGLFLGCDGGGLSVIDLGPANPQRSRGFIAVNGANLVLKLDGTLWAWGNNYFGQLGDGTTVSRTNPVQIGDGGWQAVTTSGSHSLALKCDGSLWAWGENYHGQLGIGISGSESGTNVPTRVGADNDWVSVSAGFDYTLALKGDGSFWAWGVLGNSPAQVGTDHDWAAIAANAGHYLFGPAALKTDGSLWVWLMPSNNLIRIGSDHDWAAVSAGSYHILGLKVDGSM